PFHRAAALGGTRERRGAVPPRCGVRRADRFRDRLRRCERAYPRGTSPAPASPTRRRDRRRFHLAFDVRQPPAGPVGQELHPRLTPRQREILDLIASGLSTSEIAKELTLSTETVRNHLRRVFEELHV